MEESEKQPQVLRLPSLRYGRSGRQAEFETVAKPILEASLVGSRPLEKSSPIFSSQNAPAYHLGTERMEFASR